MRTISGRVNRTTLLQLLLFAGLLFAACKKSKSGSDDGSGSPYGEPIVTPKGQPIGSAAVKTIDASGGNLTSPDGKLVITVPAGTVNTPTQFSIQPITNTFDEGKTAYRLLPEGTTFSKPVQLSYTYSGADIMNTAEDLLVLFYQTEKGTWKRMPTSLNKTQKLLTVSTTHFSDWTASGALKLEVEKKVMNAKEASKITIYGALGKEDFDFEAVPLLPTGNYFTGFINKIGKWKLMGSGTIDPKQSSNPAIFPEAIYTSPITISQTEKVTIQVEIEGDMEIDDPVNPNFDRKLKKVILLAEIDLVSDSYMIVDFEGTRTLSDVAAIATPGSMSFEGTGQDLIVALNANAAAQGVFPCGPITVPGKSYISVTVNHSSSSNQIYTSVYSECNPFPVEKYSPGSLKVTKWAEIGQTVEAEFNGPVYSPISSSPGCPQYTQKNLRVRVRAVRVL